VFSFWVESAPFPHLHSAIATSTRQRKFFVSVETVATFLLNSIVLAAKEGSVLYTCFVQKKKEGA
jgi:hypothetical protein